MDFLTERKIEAARWVIKARWLYMIGILSIGFLTKTLSQSNLSFSFVEMLLIVAVFSLINILFIFLLKIIEKEKEKTGTVNHRMLSLLNHAQIIVELVTFTFVMHKAGGVESVSEVFFFLPIVSASLLFDVYGSIIVALVSGLLINLLTLGEFYGIVPHVYRYAEPSIEYTDLSIGLTKTVTTSVFYLIIGIFSAFGAKLILNRERLIMNQKEELNKESILRSNQIAQIEKTTRLLLSRDRELSKINKELDKKIRELEYSKNSLSQALEDLNKNKQIVEEEKNKTESIIANFSDPIILLDKENRLSLFNDPAKDVLGLSKLDLNKKIDGKDEFSLDNFREIIRERFDFKKLKKPAGKEDIISIEEINLVSKNKQEESTYKVITIRISDHKKEYAGTMKIFYDVTREKMIDKMKSDFISIAAHQLRTPLSAIKWSTGMILKEDMGKITPEQENLLQKSYDSNERMINLVNDLLNVSRIEEGRFGYKFADSSLKEIIDIIVETSKPALQKNHIQVEMDQNIEKTIICADKEKLLLALQNLFDNAVKYSPTGGKIEIRVKDEIDKVSLVLRDHGVGIPKKDLPRVFSKFFRASNVTIMQTDGTGLGLFIVKSIIEKHGGQIGLKSEEGKGTEITIVLPKACVNE